MIHYGYWWTEATITALVASSMSFGLMTPQVKTRSFLNEVSENTSVAMPIKNMVGIIIATSMGIFAY